MDDSCDSPTSNSNNPNTTIAAMAAMLGKPETRAPILLAAVAFHAPLMLALSSRQRRSGHPVLRSLLWGVSAAYFPLMTYVLSYLTAYVPSATPGTAVLVLVLVVLVQFIRAKADMAALAVAAVASPATGDNDVNSLKIRLSTESFVNTFWVAGLVTYNVYKTLSVPACTDGDATTLAFSGAGAILMFPLWLLGACKTVLRFAAFQAATVSVALGRNVQLIDGYMLQLRDEGGGAMDDDVPRRLIVTGERDQDVVESPLGFQVKRSSLQDQRRSRLVTLDRVWRASSEPDRLLVQDDRDLCLSFALFKCLRRRFAGYGLAAEAGSSWAFRFVCDGLLGPPDDHQRVFRVVAMELSFASDFFHSPLPVASLGTAAASLQFFFSLIILPCLLILGLVLLVFADSSSPLALLALVLTLFDAGMEISEMVESVRSNWTKINMIGHLVRSRHRCGRRFLACLVHRCKARTFWKDEIRQTQLLPWPRHRRCCFINNFRDHRVEVPPAVKEAILKSLRRGGGHLSDGTEAIRRHAFARGNDITWACRCRHGGGVLATITDAILVWHVATTLFDMKMNCHRRSDSAAASPPPPSTTAPPPVASSNADVALCLSRYCMYLVAEAPDLLPDKSAWVTCRYKAVKKRIEEAPKCSSGDESSVYQHLLDTFGENSGSHEVLINGVKLGKQLVDEASQGGGGGGGAGAGAEAEDRVWELLSEFWSEMLLYLAPSDNVKAHIEALQRGGELITLLWALLLHAGITSRPPEFNFSAPTGDSDAIVVHNC